MTKKVKVDKNKKTKRKWPKIVGILLILITLSIVGYVFSIYDHAKDSVNEKMNKKVESIDASETMDKVDDKEILNILLLGVDERSDDGGRSDSLMVLSLNPDQKKTTIVSIPRDTLAEIAGKGIETKINHAYAYGGADMSVATVENLLDIDLDYFVELNMEGLADLMNAIGGVTLYNDLDWYDEEGLYKLGYHYQVGNIELSGPKALGYVRMRHFDPQGDFGRTERQRQVINAIIDKGKNMATVTKLNDIIDVMGDNLQTNMSFNDMKSLLLGYMDTTKNIESYMLQGENATIKDIFYYEVADEELEKVHDMLLGIGDTTNTASITDEGEVGIE